MKWFRKNRYRTNLEMKENNQDTIRFLYELDLYLKRRLEEEGGENK